MENNLKAMAARLFSTARQFVVRDRTGKILDALDEWTTFDALLVASGCGPNTAKKVLLASLRDETIAYRVRNGYESHAIDVDVVDLENGVVFFDYLEFRSCGQEPAPEQEIDLAISAT